MSDRANKLLVRAEGYLDAAMFFYKSAAEYSSASKELSSERADWLKAISGLVVTNDGFQKRVDDYQRVSRLCHQRGDVYIRKHDRAMRRYYRYIGVEAPEILDEAKFFFERYNEKLREQLRKVTNGRYFRSERKVRRDDDPSLF